MIKIDNLSKYYHNDGNVVLGLRKISLEFKIGEFVAITGESGSGKSTLLNVISGLDTYEDGELYINNEETSYYDDTDWENYRRQYIGFVFQNYNLIDSYNVLENVETALIIAGVSKKERRKRAIDILNKVGLGNHLKHKGTKLSGGEKQRLAIARAIAKDAPVIVADEPTGNLDSKTGEQIIELLHEISKEKLVIIVTHNYGIVEKYVTRKVRIYDGEVVENIEYKKPEEDEVVTLNSKEMPRYKKALIFSALNTKNQPKRSIFMLMVILVTTFVISLSVGQFVSPDSYYGGYNNYFPNATPDRIVIKKLDESPITEADYNNLINLKNVKYIIKDDMAVDMNGYIETEYSGFNGFILSVDGISKEDLVSGRLPEKPNEIVVTKNYYLDLTLPYKTKLMIDLRGFGHFTLDEIEIVGVVADQYPQNMYLTESLIHKLINNYIYVKDSHVSSCSYLENNELRQFDLQQILLYPDESLKDDEVKVLQTVVGDIKNNDVSYTMTFDDLPEVYKIIDVKAGQRDMWINPIYVSPNVYKKLVLVNNDHLQHSVYVNNVSKINDTIEKIKDLGYYAFSPYEASRYQYFDIGEIITKVITVIFSALIIFCIYILSFLVIKTILNSKKRDYGILKSVGLDAKTIKYTLLYEIVFMFILAFIILLIVIMFTRNTSPIKDIYEGYRWQHYLILLVTNIIIGVLTSLRYNRKMIEKSIIAQTKVE